MQRALDHLVLPTASLETARARLGRLGFTVAPEGIHPFGTANVCVYFPGGVFLEALALRDGAAAAEAISHGNVFVARDHVYRAMRGEEGFSAIVLASDDAERDHTVFAAADVSGGDMLTFARQAADASGKAGTASFRLAFAADVETADAFLFTCQRIDVPKIDRAALERHSNGVTAIREIVLSEHADSFLCLLEQSTGGSELSNASFRMAGPGDPAILRDSGATLAGIVFGVADLAALERLLGGADIVFEKLDGALVVLPAPGQGTTFIFRGNGGPTSPIG